MPSPPARGSCRRSSNEDADSDTLRGAGKEGQEEGHGDPKGSRCKVVSDSSSDDSDAHSSHENEEEEESSPPPAGGDKKRKADPTGEAEGSKKGRTLPLDCSTMAAYSGDDWLPRVKPLAKS